MEATRENVEALIRGCGGRSGILEAIKGFQYEDLTDECGYLNIHIPTRDGGYVRIYRAYDRQMELVSDRDRIRVSKLTPVKTAW